MNPPRQSVKAVLADGSELTAKRIADDQWMFMPRALAELATDIDIPYEVILMGTLVQPIDLYSPDSVKAVEAARWIMEEFVDMIGQPVQEWSMEGGLEPEDDGMPPDTVY